LADPGALVTEARRRWCPRGLVSELLVIVAICLLVFGAERLPGVARTLGTFVRRRYNDRSKKP